MLSGSMLIFGTIGIFRRHIELPSALIAFYRGVIGSVFLALLMLIRRRKRKDEREHIGGKTLLLLGLSGGLIGFNWILLFEAYDRTTVSAATLCYYMAPTFVILLSGLLLHERLDAVKLICMTLSLAGMVLVSGFAESGVPQGGELAGLAFGLGAAVLYACVVLLNKSFGSIEPLTKTVVQLSSAAIVLLPYLLASGAFTNVKADSLTLLLLGVVGIVHTGISYALYFGSMDGLPAQTVALFSYIDPVTALLLSAAFLGERMTLLGAAGAVLILGSAAFCELYGARKETDMKEN